MICDTSKDVQLENYGEYTAMYEGESKYHVASILSNMANGMDTVSQAYAVPTTASAYASGLAAGSMSSGLGITPTTLSNIEQTFIELQSVPTTSTIQNPRTQSGFVPPIVNSVATDHADMDSYGSDSSSNDMDWNPAAKRLRIGDKTTNIMSQAEIEDPQRRTHRRMMKDDDVSVEEVARRSMRRERNKVAAAKCRQRRVDHTNRLLNETDKLEQEQSSIETELQHLQQEREQLEFILAAHNPLCKVNGRGIPGLKVTPNMLAEDKPATPKLIPMTTSCDTALNLKKEVSSTVSTSRPSTLPLIKREISKDLMSTGVTITTPSSGFYSFSLDNMVDHTGLTPLTGFLAHTGLTPLTTGPTSCASESKKLSTSSDSSDGVKTPSSLISL